MADDLYLKRRSWRVRFYVFCIGVLSRALGVAFHQQYDETYFVDRRFWPDVRNYRQLTRDEQDGPLFDWEWARMTPERRPEGFDAWER